MVHKCPVCGNSFATYMDVASHMLKKKDAMHYDVSYKLMKEKGPPYDKSLFLHRDIKALAEILEHKDLKWTEPL